MHLLLKRIIPITLILFIAIFPIGCSEDEDPVSSPGEHFEAIGTVIYDASGAEIARILRGVTTDTLSAQVGVLSDHYRVKFLNDNEDIVDPPESEESSMEVDITDSNLLETSTDVPGGFEFHLQGKAAGLTSIEIKILHSGHSDYRSGLIPVKVEN